MNNEMNDELRSEYDMKSLLKDGVRGKYADKYRQGMNLALLEADVARAFPNEKAVNEALRLVVKLNEVQAGQGKVQNNSGLAMGVCCRRRR